MDALWLRSYVPAMTAHVGARIVAVARELDKPMVAYMPRVDKYGPFVEGFERNGVPVASSVEGTGHRIRALGRVSHAG